MYRAAIALKLCHGLVRVSLIMSPKSEDSLSLRHAKSPFTKAIATRYYDGPLEGFLAHRDWLQACVFRLLDWDRETDVRVYEIARVEDLAFEEVVSLLFHDRLPTWPVWVLPSSAHGRGERLLNECFTRARPVATVTTRDLFGDIAIWDPADDAPVSSGLVIPTRKQDAG
jgi:hypothetical protein